MEVNKDFKEVAEDNGGFISLCLVDYLLLESDKIPLSYHRTLKVCSS